ncbi:MAG: excinuclease ABC subunit UvrA [Planctomycetes bacterium]|nr:excinuclease ABC subunit UvrA [Planctomycetota bacterium]
MDEGRIIRVVGAREHNLKNISVDIPRERLTVVTGLSGSGKSTLVFDTIHAEGQRRYVESLSTSARQYLEQAQKPDLDRIEGLPPTLAIGQRAASANPRSTVGTATEIHDFLRVLFARVGDPHCWVCQRAIQRQTVSQIVDAVLDEPADRRILILAPLVENQRGRHQALLRRIVREGFVRARIDGEVVYLEGIDGLSETGRHTIEVIVDRLLLKPDIRSRLAESIELAVGLANGRVIVRTETSEGGYRDRRFSTRYACPDHPKVSLPELSPALFSFNSPHGACPACTGLGRVMEFDPGLVVPDPDRSLADGAIRPWCVSGQRMNAVYSSTIREFCERFNVLPDTPFHSIPHESVAILMQGTDKASAKIHGTEFEGVIPNLKRRWETTESESVKQRLHGYLSDAPCTKCEGRRLKGESLAVSIGGRSIAAIGDLSIGDARTFFDELQFDGEQGVIAAPLLREIRHRLTFLCDVGVDYLALGRPSGTLSGGELQRIRLATQIGSGLVGVCYCLDEPTIGLHQRDTRRLVATLRRLVDMGNTVIVVEHDEETIQAADHIIDVGPGAGSDGGYLVAEGTLATIMQAEESVTGQYLSGRRSIALPDKRRPVDVNRCVQVRGATANNLRGIDVRFPLSVFTCVTGVSGSGKSTLVTQILLRALKRRLGGTGPKPGAHDRIVGAEQIDKIIEIDQSPIGRTPRSNPATYVGVFDLVRQLYAKTREAKVRGYSPARFSFNVKGGRCEACQGQGTKRIEMHFLPDVFVTCSTCSGTRYSRETLEVRFRGKSIADVLDMQVAQASEFFDSFAKIKHLLTALVDVGLGYLSLGQSSTTLSGGEAQRIKLATELGKRPVGHTFYILDEPTTGLHYADIHSLLDVLTRLVAMEHTVVVIEHNMQVIKMADWVIDLGPDGGAGGGTLVAEGTPETLAGINTSHTGRFLADHLSR